jgi:hypothetical protein
MIKSPNLRLVYEVKEGDETEIKEIYSTKLQQKISQI